MDDKNNKRKNKKSKKEKENLKNENLKNEENKDNISEANVLDDNKDSDSKEKMSQEEIERLIKESGAEVINIDDLKKESETKEDTTKKLKNEVSTLKDRLLRLDAEYENYRKRTKKEKDAIYTSSIIDVVKEILPIMDTLEKSMEIETDNVDEFKKGVNLTINKFKTSLDKLGIEEIDTSKKFDPNFHDAVMHEKNDEYGEKEIAEVFIKGYKKDDKVIRYSVVKVVN